MPFAPAIPFTGLAGLKFLDRTYDRQFATFNKSPDIKREIDHFRENAANVETLDDLMGDRRLLRVILGAYGLDEDINKGAFIRKVLEEGAVDSDAFANRLVEPAYRLMAAELGFGDVGGLLFSETIREDLISRFSERQFELGVGEQDLDLRLAMNFRREAPNTVDGVQAENSAWLRLLGSEPLRSVLQTALSLPDSFALIDLDQQVEEISRRADQLFDIKSPSELSDPEKMDKLIDRFLLNGQLAAGVVSDTTRGVAALSLLQSTNAGFGSGAASGLFASNFV